MKKLVIGLGASGQAAAKFFLAKGEEVVGVDRNPSRCHLTDIAISLDSEEFPLEGIDQVILSPGVPLSHPLVQKARASKIEVIGEVELAFRHMRGPAIGITGTNGKTTVTSLVTHVLNHSGRAAEALGNIGTPLIAATESDKIAVIELSSYQLETIQTKKLSAAAILNITPDHLDRYKVMDEYVKAKFLIQDALIPGGLFILEETTALSYPSYIRREALTYSWEKPPFLLPPPLGERKNHDAENLIAAFYLTERFGVTSKEFLAAYAAFKKPPHRIEFVLERQGVRFWDDSKGTNIDATIRAVEGMQGEVILIAGGVDKGFPYTAWIDPFKGKVKKVVALGEAAPKIENDLQPAIPVKLVCTLKEAVQEAIEAAQNGDNVLLSPGCASFDMFKDYADRGDQFKSLVRSLT